MSGKLKWRFDASTFKLLGRGLITDRITAIYELVKNCYDANATNVQLEFYNVDKRNSNSKIIIRDNGHGMSLNDIKNKWLVVGTSSKRTNLFSSKPFQRRYIGEKGVGRFATDKLGEHLRIRTKQKNDTQILDVTINWKEYERLNNIQTLLFTDLENEYQYIDDDKTFKNGHGTELCITLLHEAWDKEMLLRLLNQLTRILSPAHSRKPPFDIHFHAPQFAIEYEKIEPEPIEKLATVHVSIPFNANQDQQGILVFDEKDQTFNIAYEKSEVFGLISMDLYYFDAEAQKKFKAKYEGTENYIEGVKIYRDEVICTPFAEYEIVLDKRRDVLGIDKRRHQEAFDKLSTREVIGVVNITKDRNPEIKDATNRQDFVDNAEYRRLKEFIIEQLDVLVKYKFIKRKEKKTKVQNNLKRASADVKGIESDLIQIVKENPELKSLLTPTIEKAKNVTNTVKDGVKEQQETEKEFLRKENLYLSLMSLQDFANDLAHGIRFAITPIKHASEFFINNYPNEKYEQLFIKYAHNMFEQTEKISYLVDFMLSYTEVDIEDTTFSIKALLDDVLKGAYEITFGKENINIEIDISTNIELTGNRKFLEDVLTNLVSNSVKALKNTEEKKIKCESYIDGDNLYILFSDNGHGVDKKIESKIFEMFKTTTAEQGGAGLGLFIARTRMEALNGKIELDQSVFNPLGATFKITLPLNKFKK